MNIKWLLLVSGILAGCSQKTTPSATKVSNEVESGKNNLIVTKETNVLKKGTGDKIIFEGSNNIFDLVQENASYFDGREVVVIVQGNNNIIKLYNQNIVDKSSSGVDTLLLIGGHTKYVMDVNNSVVLKRPGMKADTILMQPKSFTPADFSQDFNETDYRIKSLTERLATNEPEAFYELAKLYQYEVADKQASLKAIELYEYAAANNHLEAIRNLGDIFANGTFDLKPNIPKAQYYFTLGANLNDLYSKERLDELRNQR